MKLSFLTITTKIKCLHALLNFLVYVNEKYCYADKDNVRLTTENKVSTVQGCMCKDMESFFRLNQPIAMSHRHILTG